MANRRYQQREKLFNLFSKNLSLLDSEQQDVFVCPLCLSILPRAALEGENPAVNLAHIISEKLGGKRCTLTCSECNSGNGSLLEAALVDRIAAEDKVAGVGLTSGLMTTDAGKIGIDFQHSPNDGTFSIYAIRNKRYRSNLHAFEQHLRSQTGKPDADVSFTLTVQYPHRPKQVEAAVYQSAYLLMFSQFGYDFVVHAHYASMREQIRRPTENIWKTDILEMNHERAASLLGARREVVLFLSEPPAIVAVLRMQAEGGRKRVFGVVLPGLESPSICEIPKTFSCKILPHVPKILTEMGTCLRSAWAELR